MVRPVESDNLTNLSPYNLSPYNLSTYNFWEEAGL